MMKQRRKAVRNAVDRAAAMTKYHELLRTARLNDREAFKLMVEHWLWEAEELKPVEMFVRDFDRTPETFRNWLKRDGYEHLIDPVKSAAGKAGAEAKHEACQKDFGTGDEPNAADDGTTAKPTTMHVQVTPMPTEPTKVNAHVREADGADDTSPGRRPRGLDSRIRSMLKATDNIRIPDSPETLEALGIRDTMQTAHEARDLAEWLCGLAAALEHLHGGQPKESRDAA